ncbi:hypothetical protein KP509_10G010400 [Ceratopteris richardii]|uniref:Uncharacterized protein n=1 Tax=Ceratopteris richardii TaxID=49495 RepID=A0A8T2TWJ6_CERRI|nr:hypothetical protein KP509_10G010400 [Ceratopteris richardii]
MPPFSLPLRMNILFLIEVFIVQKAKRKEKTGGLTKVYHESRNGFFTLLHAQCTPNTKQN